MKFQIQEQRGKFRIKKTEIVKKPKYTVSFTPFGPHLTVPLLSDGVAWTIDPMDAPATSCAISPDTREHISVSGNWFRKTIERTITITNESEYDEDTTVLYETYEHTDEDGDTYSKSRVAEFDSYKKAEAYVQKLYGTKGVESIEKPDWKQA